VARDVIARRRREGHERAGDEADNSEQQRRVDREQRPHRAHGGAALGGVLDLAAENGAHRVLDAPRTTFFLTPNHWERISRAAGAAACAPKPPRSMVTATTIGRLRSGA